MKIAKLQPQNITSNPNYRWAIVAMLWFICFFNYADRVALASVFPVLKKEYGFDTEQVGLIGSAFTWVYALSAPFAGQVGDKFARKWVILGGLYVWSLITGMTALCSKVWHFVLVRGAEGLGETFYMPASMALVSDYHGSKTRSRAIGIHQTSIYAGTIFGGTLAGAMALKYSWQSPFIVLGVAGIVLGLVVSALIREPRRNQADLIEQGHESDVVQESLPMRRFLIEFMRNRTAVLLILAFFGSNTVGQIFLMWMPSFLGEKFKMNLASAGLGATVYTQLASMLGASIGGFAADILRRKYIAGRILIQASGVVLGAPFIYLCGYTKNVWTLIFAMALFGLGKGIHDANLTPAFYEVIPPARRSTATGLMNFIGFVGGGLGVYFIGYAVQHGVTMSAAISSTASLYVGVATLLLVAAKFTAPKDIAAA